jgi:ubiquinone/menaquinone biosynthesis C-methylase UbiE
MAWSYDVVAWLVSLGSWGAWRRTALPYLVGDRVLELGHGPGHLLGEMHQRGFNPIGLDRSPQMGRQARRRLERIQFDGQTPLVRALAEHLPFRDSSFDCVVATFPTEYIVDPNTLSEISRILGRDDPFERGHPGRLVVVAWVRFLAEGPVNRLLAWLYAITGQSKPEPALRNVGFERFALDVQVVRERMDRAEVTLVVADHC